ALEAEQLARALYRAMVNETYWLLDSETNFSLSTQMMQPGTNFNALERAALGWPPERIRKDLADRPDLKADLLLYLARHSREASIVFHGSDAASPWSNASERLEMLREALKLRAQIYGKDHLAVAEVMNDLAEALNEGGKVGEAEGFACAGLEIRRRMAREKLEVAASLARLAAGLSAHK